MGNGPALDGVDITVMQPLSVAAAFFRAYPRLGAASKVFSTSTSYRSSLYLLGIPYMATGIVLLLSALIANFYFYSRRSVVPGADDTHTSDPDKRDATGKLFLLYSCFLNLAIILCIAMSFTSAFSMRAAANGARDVVGSTTAGFVREVATPAGLVFGFVQKAKKLDTSEAVDSVRAVVKMLLDREEHFEGLVTGIDNLRSHLAAVDNEVQHLSIGYFWFTFAVLITVVCGLLLSVIADATTPDAKRVRMSVFAFLLIPMAATWAHTAVSTWVAVASADFCHSVGEYQQTLTQQALGRAGSMSNSNIFFKYKLECPANVPSFATDLRKFNLFLGDSKMQPSFHEGLSVVSESEISSDAWFESVEWMQDMVGEFRACDVQLRFGAHLSYYLCGDHGTSAVSAVSQLWLCSCGFTLLFSVIVALLTWGHPPAEFCAGRELLCIYGAPKLISAFGDVRGVRTRHTPFRQLQSEKLRKANKHSSASSRSSERSLSGKYISSEEDNTTTEGRSKNAYIAHALRDRKMDSRWFMHFDDDSSDLDKV